MILTQVLQKQQDGKPVRAAVIGTGHFATAVVTQSRAMPALDVPVICDIDVEAAQLAYQRAGLHEEDYTICSGHGAVMLALERGKRVIVNDAALLWDLPVDVIVESTGNPEAAARHALAAINAGKHVAMVSKEADVCVGPILRHHAERAGVVYSPVDGDQHGLLMALVAWAQALGLEVVSGGKALDAELIYDEKTRSIIHHPRKRTLRQEEAKAFAALDPALAPTVIGGRRAAARDLAAPGGFDTAEMVIAANGTKLVPDVPRLHCPLVRIPEIPEVLIPQDEGGILKRRGIIDMVTILRGPYEAGMGGGVFIVVAAENAYSRHILHTKGLIANQRGTAAVIYRPYHLCGVETPITLLTAALLKQPTGGVVFDQRFDLLARAATDLHAGDRVGDDHSHTMFAEMVAAQPVQSGKPVPLHMANGNRLRVKVTAGTMLTVDMIERPADSVLWALRQEQDALAEA